MINTLFDLKGLVPQITDDELLQLHQYLPPLALQTWQKNDFLFQEQQSFTHCVVLIDGLVRCFYLDDSHKNCSEVNLRLLSATSIVMPFADMAKHWLLANTPHNNTPPPSIFAHESIQCITPVSGYTLPLSFFDNDVAVIQKIKNELALQHYLSMENRLRMIQLKKASDRYQYFLATMPQDFIQNMPSLHIASYLGITAETLSRLKVN